MLIPGHCQGRGLGSHSVCQDPSFKTRIYRKYLPQMTILDHEDVAGHSLGWKVDGNIRQFVVILNKEILKNDAIPIVISAWFTRPTTSENYGN